MRDANGAVNQIAYWSRIHNWNNQTWTPNPDTLYFMPFFSTKEVGPLVIEIPAADEGSITGTIMNCWQEAREDVGPAGMDKGKGGKYYLSVGLQVTPMAPGRSTRISIRMQPAGGLSRIIKHSNAESADPQIMKSFRAANPHKNGRSRSGQLCLVSAKEVHHVRHEDAARTRGVSAIDEDSEVSWRSRHLEDAAHRVFKFGERVRIAKYQFCSGACRQDEPGHRHAAFYISATDAAEHRDRLR